MQSRRRNFADRFSPDYRKFGRGGRSRRRGPQNSPPPAPYVPAPPLRRRAEVLREAGRLAAEYLAAKGLLPAIPASASTGAEKWWPKAGGGGDEADRASAFSRLGRRKIDGDEGGFRAKRRVRRRRHRGESHRLHDSDRAADADDLDKPWRFQERERRFADAIDGESDPRSLSEESDGGNGQTLRLQLKDETSGESENESGAKATESSDKSRANAEIPPGSSRDDIEENFSEEQTNLPSASFKTCDLNSVEAPSLEGETNFQQRANPAVLIDLEDEPDSSEANPQNLGGIQDGYGIDETLFVSIGDIPINFMDVWDQAPGDYGKFF